MPIDIEDGFAPGFLIAAPDLTDSLFSRSVVLLAESNEEGAMGFIVNRTVPVSLGDLGSSLDIKIPSNIADRSVMWGGPVRPEQGWLLAFHREVVDSLVSEPLFTFDDGLYVIDELRTLQAFLPSAGENSCRMILGFSGWGEQQLAEEMQEGTWLPLAYDSDLIFECNSEDMWSYAMECIGIDPAFYVTGPANA